VSDHRPIGVFDSGLGGLTVVKALRKLLPNESIIYFGDTARVPYGNKSKELIVEYSKEITDFLIKRGAKMIVVACNTASAMALNSLKKNISIPVLGVINPGAIEAIGATQNDHIGIIGTVATITSGAYVNAIHQIDHKIKTSIQACPLLGPPCRRGVARWRCSRKNSRSLSGAISGKWHRYVNLGVHSLSSLKKCDCSSANRSNCFD